jgi:hypothetical protein
MQYASSLAALRISKKQDKKNKALNLPELEADHLFLAFVEIRNARRCACTPSAFMACLNTG